MRTRSPAISGHRRGGSEGDLLAVGLGPDQGRASGSLALDPRLAVGLDEAQRRPLSPPGGDLAGQRRPAVAPTAEVGEVVEVFLVHAQSRRRVEVVGVDDDVDEAAVGGYPLALLGP